MRLAGHVDGNAIQHVKLGGLASRAPRGARGLKCFAAVLLLLLLSSCPSRGTWIEMDCGCLGIVIVCCRAPRGARGLKCVMARSAPSTVAMSYPSRGTWIEIISAAISAADSASCPSRGTWIEMLRRQGRVRPLGGRAPRGALDLNCLYYG